MSQTLLRRSQRQINGDLSLTNGGTALVDFVSQNGNLALERPTAGENMNIGIFTQNGDGTDSVRLDMWAVGTLDDVVNRERLIFGWDANDSIFTLIVENNGTGSPQDFVARDSFATGSGTEWFRLKANGGVNIGAPGTDAGSKGDISIEGDMRVEGAVVEMTNLPTSDPTSAGQLWNNSGVLTVSAG